MNASWHDGNRVRLLENGDQFFPCVFEAIRRAQHSVMLETFILFEDEVGNALHAVILAAARRGIKIQIMVDGYGSPSLSAQFIQSLTAAGVRFIYYDPRRMILGMRTNVFRRLHRKMIVIDDIIAFVGGINFSAEHYTHYGPHAKQDYHIEVKGPVVNDIADYMRCAFGHHPAAENPRGYPPHGSTIKPTFGSARVLFVWRDNDQHRDDIEQHYLEMLRSAQHNVIIANAYFFPGYRLLHEMRNTAQRGVKVQLIVQGEPDMPIAKTGAEMLYGYLLEAGVEVYEYLRRPLHGKVAVKDEQWATVGSSNLDPLSLSFNLEANLIIHDRHFQQQLRDNLQSLIEKDCRRIDETFLPPRNWWQLTKSVLVFHFLRHFPAISGWLPAHTPRLHLVPTLIPPEIETQEPIEPDNNGVKP